MSVQKTELKNQLFGRKNILHVLYYCVLEKPIGRVHWQRVMSCSAVNRAAGSSISSGEEKNDQNDSRKRIAGRNIIIFIKMIDIVE